MYRQNFKHAYRQKLQPSQVIFAIVSVTSLLLTALSDKFLPEQFLRDSIYFEQRLNSRASGYTDSFQTIVNLYGTLGITQASVGLRIIEWSIFYSALILSRRLQKTSKESILTLFVSCFYLALLPFYGSLFTKEFLVVVILNIYLMAKQFINVKYELFLIVLFGFTIALTLRRYYLITLGFTLIYYLLRRNKTQLKLLFPVSFLSLLATFNTRTQVITEYSGIDIFQIRNATNDSLKLVARSRIEQRAPSGNIIDNFLNFLHVAQQVLLPFQLLRADAYGLFTVLTVIVVNFILVRHYLLTQNALAGAQSSFLYAFFTTALIFEPDLGSYVRHGFIFLLVALTQPTQHKDSRLPLQGSSALPQ